MVLHSHLRSIFQWSDEEWAYIHQLHLSACSHPRVTSCARWSIILSENMPKISRQDEGLKKNFSFLCIGRIYHYPHQSSGRSLNSITKVLWSPENTQWMAGSIKELSKTYSFPLEQCSFFFFLFRFTRLQTQPSHGALTFSPHITLLC